MFTRRDALTSRERALTDEVEMLRADNERHAQQSADAAARRRQEMRQLADEAMRTPEDWPDALRKQSHLCRAEAHLDADLPDPFFTTSADACDQAVVWWAEAADRRQPEIDRLMEQVAAIQREIRLAVAAQLEAAPESTASGWRSVANALRTEDDPTAWLQW